MSIKNDTNKPCLVETRQGLSVLYENRFLYSKYNPAANIERLVDTLEFKNDTLILCFSPILGYGLNKLAEKLPTGCFMLIIEANKDLLELYNQDFINAKKFATENPSDTSFPKAAASNIGFLGPSRLDDIYHLLTKKNQVTDNGVQIPHPGSFKYCVRIDFSAAPALRQEEYQRIQQRAELAVANFWKNRLTLIKMGRLYHRNILRNLALLPYSHEIPINKINYPVLVLGAGPSADKTIEILSSMTKESRKKLFILAVDAVIPALLAQKITPDLVLALECQHAIQQAYTNTSDSELFLVADLTSRPSILHYDTCQKKNPNNRENLGKNCSGGSTAFFSTEFTGSRFLERLQQQRFIQQVLPPMGSVGIVAMEMALLLRKNTNVPVYVSGLDFSFLLERSHCKESFQVKNTFLKTNRINPAGSYHCLTNPTTEKQLGKSGMVYTDQILSYYRQIFCDRFQGIINAYDVGNHGLDLGLERRDFSQIASEISLMKNIKPQETAPSNGTTVKNLKLAEKIREFYLAEEAILHELKEGLSTGNISQERILEILEEADYLYLHFPDGYKPSLDISFLKRVRSEIDFFLKDITLGKKLLEE